LNKEEKRNISVIKDIVYIGRDLPDEYAHSEYTRILKGANSKAKANAAQGIPELIENAYNRKHKENRKEKHKFTSTNGWYCYDSRFALPVYGYYDELIRYNVFNVYLIVRCDKDGNKYLYDMLNIKKETSTPLGC